MDETAKGLEEGQILSQPFTDDRKSFSVEVEDLENHETHRGLSSRHIQFLALGGCIGTGLFVGSGQSLSTVGPGEERILFS